MNIIITLSVTWKQEVTVEGQLITSNPEEPERITGDKKLIHVEDCDQQLCVCVCVTCSDYSWICEVFGEDSSELGQSFFVS